MSKHSVQPSWDDGNDHKTDNNDSGSSGGDSIVTRLVDLADTWLNTSQLIKLIIRWSLEVTVS